MRLSVKCKKSYLRMLGRLKGGCHSFKYISSNLSTTGPRWAVSRNPSESGQMRVQCWSKCPDPSMH